MLPIILLVIIAQKQLNYNPIISSSAVLRSAKDGFAPQARSQNGIFSRGEKKFGGVKKVFVGEKAMYLGMKCTKFC